MEIGLAFLAVLLVVAALALAVLLTRAREGARRLQAEARLADADRLAAALTAERDAAAEARLAAERALAAAREQLAAAEARMADFERLRQDSLQAAQAAVLETAQQLSSKLLDDHKRESAEAKKEAEERVRQTAEHLVRQVDEIAKAVPQLNGQVQEKGRVLDTMWRALSSPGGAGQLAEIGLANTLKGFGLELGRDFLLQHTTHDDDSGRRLRPDAIVFLPGNSALVIDCKASKFLLEIAAAEGTEQEHEAYRNLARTMNQHLKGLAEKDYRSAVLAAWRQSGRGDEISRTLSVMYLPNEAALEKLYRADPEFVHRARAAQIIPAGPAGLHCAMSLASVEINLMRQVENQARSVETAQRLLDSIAVAIGHAAAVGRGLKAAAESFAKFTGSVNQRLLPRARGLGRLGLQPTKPLPANLPSYAVHSLEGDQLIEGEVAEIEGGETATTGTPLLAK
jgi:DNA recombination protein RmuC